MNKEENKKLKDRLRRFKSSGKQPLFYHAQSKTGLNQTEVEDPTINFFALNKNGDKLFSIEATNISDKIIVYYKNHIEQAIEWNKTMINAVKFINGWDIINRKDGINIYLSKAPIMFSEFDWEQLKDDKKIKMRLILSNEELNLLLKRERYELRKDILRDRQVSLDIKIIKNNSFYEITLSKENYELISKNDNKVKDYIKKMEHQEEIKAKLNKDKKKLSF